MANDNINLPDQKMMTADEAHELEELMDAIIEENFEALKELSY